MQCATVAIVCAAFAVEVSIATCIASDCRREKKHERIVQTPSVSDQLLSASPRLAANQLPTYFTRSVRLSAWIA
jgi:hypothetical protein